MAIVMMMTTMSRVAILWRVNSLRFLHVFKSIAHPLCWHLFRQCVDIVCIMFLAFCKDPGATAFIP
jgi:hypothetical protein